MSLFVPCCIISSYYCRIIASTLHFYVRRKYWCFNLLNRNSVL